MCFELTPHLILLTVRYKIHKYLENAKKEKERFEASHPYEEEIQDDRSEYPPAETRRNRKYDPDVSLEEETLFEDTEEGLPIDSDVYDRIVNGNEDCVTYDSEIPPFDAEISDQVVLGGSVLSRKDGSVDLKAVFNDNGKEVIFRAGDIGATGYGQGHGIENRSDEPVEMIALIVSEA